MHIESHPFFCATRESFQFWIIEEVYPLKDRTNIWNEFREIVNQIIVEIYFLSVAEPDVLLY